MFFRELDYPIEKIPGIGKATASVLHSMNVYMAKDLLLLSPRHFEDRSIISCADRLREIDEPVMINTFVEPVRFTSFGGFRKKTLKVIVQDLESETNLKISLLCFGRDFLKSMLIPGNTYYFYGQVSRYGAELQSSSFEIYPMKKDGEPPNAFGQILPIYPLKEKLTQNIMRKAVTFVLDNAPKFDDELPYYIREQMDLEDTDTAIRNWHFPKTMEDHDKARKTLAFTELFYMQLKGRENLDISKREYATPIPTMLENRLISSLPFALTKDQMNVIREIRRDLECSVPMNRMLQGDVGSGKTLVAWISSLHILSKNRQVAFMAPTELLAQQHATGAGELLAPLGVRLALLTGSMTAKEKARVIENVKTGDVDILIGTHALFSSNVVFRDLGLVIIDEQQRFGVEQRTALIQKAKNPHILMMSATPIPRTLALTVFGDLEVSTIKTMPEGRVPIITHLVSEKSRERMYRAIGVEFSRSHQAYFVYPRIDDTGQSELRDVTNMYEYLKKLYPGIPSGLVHSRLSDEEKMQILSDFRAKKIMYIVATSVVEVGIDIPDATCMVIEHAERFGLSALHQLRGRVGRSSLQSYCFLVYSDSLTEDGKQRLKVMKESNDGFYISEQDLIIRGPGEIVGTRQSGYLKLHFASLTSDFDLIKEARRYCDDILAGDGGMIEAQHAVIREVLTKAPLFG